MTDRPFLEVVKVVGSALVQDGGRPGRMHEGIPVGGALVPELLAAANVAAGNAEGAAAIEIIGRATFTAGSQPLAVATERGPLRVLGPSEAIEVVASAPSVVAYLAVQGGFAIPEVLGGRGTLASAGFGGYDGRALRRGDRLPVGELATAQPGAPVQVLDPSRTIRVVLGPDAARFEARAVDVLLGEPFRVSPRTSRAGMRLDGPLLPRSDDDDGRSAPMVRGAIQVPRGGAAIVLGPDGPTTGGYPVIATVVAADLGALASRRPGADVRFARADQG